MSLATRCSECGTVFRVVRDQLKVSEGWVRCGRCSSVFNALEGLFDLDDDPTGEGASAKRVLDELAQHQHPRAHADAFEPTASAPPIGSEAGLETPPDFTLAAPPVNPPTAADEAPAAIVSFSAEPAAIVTGDQAQALHIDADEAAPPPQFVLAADRAAFWRRPVVRGGLIAASLLLAAALALQATLAWRDLVAARLPALRPALAAWCNLAGCRIGAPRRIERLSVDASGLTRVEGTPLYRLSLVLHNRADIALAPPALDLTLTDVAGKLAARRVLMPAEFGLAAPVIEPGQEMPLQALLATGERRVSGYTVELFYP